MTIGERIALKRREQGLSQEALGESLGVTRQSISKWEGDVTLPEIDKLIALSRLFGVSVDWLLGEERRERIPEKETEGPEGVPEEIPGEPESPPPEELSKEQLRRVEELVGRYLAARSRPASPRRRRTLGLAAVLAVLCVAAGFLRLSGQIRQVREENEALRQAIGSIQYSIGSQISQMEELWKAQNTLFTSYNASKESVDLRGNTVKFRVSALPKSYETGMSVTFLLDNGRDTVKAEGSAYPGGRFEAPITCILTDEISVYAVLHRPDGTEDSQLLAQFSNLYSETVPGFGIRDDGVSLEDAELSDRVLTVPEQLVIAVPGSLTGGPTAKVRAVQMGLFKNQHLVEWCEPTEAPEGYREVVGFEDFLFFEMRERSVLLEPGDRVGYALAVTDEYGRVTVQCGDLYNYGSFRDKANGLPMRQEAVPEDWGEYGAMEEWSLTREFLDRSPGHRF